MEDLHLNKYDHNIFDKVPVLEDRIMAQIDFHNRLKLMYLDLFYSIHAPIGSEVNKCIRKAMKDIDFIIQVLKHQMTNEIIINGK